MVVREAMIVPLQGGVNGCSLANNFQSSRDLCLRSAAMEQKSKGVVDNCNLGAHETGHGWKRNSSEGSISSIDSLPCGETGFSPVEIQQSMFRKPLRLGIETSDDESMLDQAQEESLLRKAKRSGLGGNVQPHSAMAQALDEGDHEAGLITSRPSALDFQEGKLVGSNTTWFPSATRNSSRLHQYIECLPAWSQDAFVPRRYTTFKLADGFTSCKALLHTESLPNFRIQSESHMGACSVGLASAAQDHSSTPSDDGKDFPSSRVKFMCSFGGRILPRPADHVLRYVGGQTRIITINRDITFSELRNKMKEIYGQCLTLKYQLPDEDLDALVSVSSDEDLENMMEEYDKLEAEGSSRLRVFLFASDSDGTSFDKDPVGDQRNSEQRYVDAVNGFAESSNSKRVSEGLLGVSPVSSDLLGLEFSEPSWGLARGAEGVPMAVLAPHLSHDPALIHQVPVAHPVTTLSNSLGRPKAPSAPSSAPSSPPLLSRPLHSKLPMGTDLHQYQFHQETQYKGVGPQYTGMTTEGVHQENESYGGSGTSSAASQHEMHYRSTESRRGPESPPKKFLEVLHQDYPIAVEQATRRLSGTKMPRVGSHGKLTRLSEHSEHSSRVDSQQLTDMHLPTTEFSRMFQQQTSLWPHNIDTQQDSYRRPDLLQATGPQPATSGQPAQGYQQQQHQHMFRSGLPQSGAGHEGAYRQGDQQQQQSQQFQEDLLHNASYIPRSVSSHAIAAGLTAGHVGSAPSSPRPAFRDMPSRHLAGAPQVQQVPWTYNGGGYVEQSAFSRRLTNYGDQSNRSFRHQGNSNSPPRYRDHMTHIDERLHRDHMTHSDERLHRQAQQVPESMHHEQVPTSSQLLFETTSVAQPQYDLLSRPQVPQQYKGLNPFQEKLNAFQEHQDVNDVRRHVLHQGKESQLLPQPQHLHAIHQPQRLDYQESLMQPIEQLPHHARFQESQDGVLDWKTQERMIHGAQEEEESRKRVLGRVRQAEKEEEAAAETGVSQLKDTHQGVYPGLHLPNDEDLLTPSLGDYTAGNRRSDRQELTSGFPFRHGPLPPSVLGGYSTSKPRGNVTDTIHVSQYGSRPNDNDYLAAAGLRGGGNVQDLRSNAFEVNGHQQTSTFQVPPGSHRLADVQYNPMTQLQKLRINDNMALSNNEMRWNGGLGSEDVRNEVPVQTRDRMGNNMFEDRLLGLPSLALSRNGGKLSRPSSSSNIPNIILDGEIGEGSILLPGSSYGTQAQGTSLIDAEHSIQLNDNPLYSDYGGSHSHASVGFDSSLTGGMPDVGSSLDGASNYAYFKHTAGDHPPSFNASSQIFSTEGDISDSSSSSPGRSVTSKSESEGALVGQLTMNQHTVDSVLAVLDLDRNGSVAHSVLGTSPVREVSQAGTVYDRSLCDSGSGASTGAAQSTWHLTSAPTLAAGLWERKLDEAGMTEETFERHITSDGTTLEELADEHETHETLLSAVDKETQEEIHPGVIDEQKVEDKVSSTGLYSDPAAEARAQGLQTILNADLEELRELGSGTFGTVYHGKWRGTDVAIKRIKASCFAGRPSEQQRLIQDFWREACNLGNLHHPNVVAFYGIVADGPGGTLATVTEYMVNGSLKQVLQKKDRTIDRRKRLLIAMDAAMGMEYLHLKNIVHFDLKCENLLVNMRDPHRPICKVGDLGLSKVKKQTMVSGGVRGTLPWMAPELLNGCSSLVTEKVDVFSFGIVMWELLTGEEPYDKMHYGAIIGGIVNNTLRPLVPSWCDPGWRSLMERCWANDPSSRPSFSEIATELRSMSAALQPKPQGQTQGPSHLQPQVQIHA